MKQYNPEELAAMRRLQQTIDTQLAAEIAHQQTRVNIGVKDGAVMLAFEGIGSVTMTPNESRYMAGLLRQAANEADKLEPYLSQAPKPTRRRHKNARR